MILKSKPTENDNLIEELFEVEEFLIIFTKNLLNSISPESALLISIKQYEGKLKNKFQVILNEIALKGNSLSNSINQCVKLLINPQSKQIFLFLMDFLGQDPKSRAEGALKLLYRIRENKQLYFKRKNLVKAQEFKIKFLVFIMCIVLGILTSLSPWFSLLNILNQGIIDYNILNLVISTVPSIYIVITFALICLINSYFLYDILGIKNKSFYLITTFTLFISTVLLSNFFLAFIMT